MNRAFRVIFDSSCDLEFITFKEKDSEQYLTFFQPIKHYDHYYLPPTTLTIKGKDSIKKLYNVLIYLDRKYDFSQSYVPIKESATMPITPDGADHPIVYFTHRRSTFKFVESDNVIKGGGYKPTKQISADTDVIKRLYNLLQHVYGMPISMRPRNREDNVEEVKNEEVKKSGWEILK
ncbi:hypothetical protein ACSU64_04415 [Bacillaceae bacterium C204]|uniref:hypothetical protein n=1 Tax=Neobacillus sp. 204 TaxID=3383351 RepID=UPI00397C96A7